MSDARSHAYANPTKDCDLIMKGGVTSGVVYPQVICELARTYRFRCIGGTSAGAIGAVMAAAAEYRRHTGQTDAEKSAGFEEIETMPAELAKRLPTFFQPSARTEPLFSIGMAAIRAKGSVIWATVRQTLRSFVKEVAIGALPGIMAFALTNGIVGFLLGVVVLLVGILAAVGYGLFKALVVDLPAQDFGMCSGLTQRGMQQPAFTNWITDKVDAVAGRSAAEPPLTIGDLQRFGIQLASVTTDLSSRRPYELPFGSDVHSFRRSEFEKIFPERIMSYLLTVSPKLGVAGPNGSSDYYMLPGKEKFPVAMIARMSLSFPGLIMAVPLHRIDQSMLPQSSAGSPIPVRCLFSDGGITSNFPIHLFDSLLPGRPTFGIALSSYDALRHGVERVYMPDSFHEGPDGVDRTPVLPIGSLFEFGAAVISTARNWQDTLQSQLHGYSERIVEIRLDDKEEGGLNLDMDAAIVDRLNHFGKEAGQTVLNNFSFNEHRWRRAVTALPTLAASLHKMSERMNQSDAGPDALLIGVESYPDLLSNHVPNAFTKLSDEDRNALLRFAEAAAAAGALVSVDKTEAVSHQNASLRVTASMETTAQPSEPVAVAMVRGKERGNLPPSQT